MDLFVHDYINMEKSMYTSTSHVLILKECEQGGGKLRM